MSLITIVIALIVVGVLLWLMETYVPMDATIKRIIEAIVIIVVVLWLLQVFGILNAANQVKIEPIR
jgi:hypothetical protein